MRRPVVLASLATALLAAACSSSSTPAAVETPSPVLSPTPTPSLPPVVTPSPTPSATPTVPAVVPTGSESPAPVGQPTCQAPAVTVTDADTVVKPGYRAEVYVLRTTGRACQLSGYPTVSVAGAAVTRGGEGLPAEAPRAYTLTPGTSLSFALATGRSGSCTDRGAMTVILPGTTQRKAVTTDLQVCNGRLGVSPVHRLGDDE